jgi:hypothetical protein
MTPRTPNLTGADVAEMMGVPHDNAVVERETPTGPVAISLDETLRIAGGEEFLVTRQFIMGGSDGLRPQDAGRR